MNKAELMYRRSDVLSVSTGHTIYNQPPYFYRQNAAKSTIFYKAYIVYDCTDSKAHSVQSYLVECVQRTSRVN